MQHPIMHSVGGPSVGGRAGTVPARCMARNLSRLRQRWGYALLALCLALLAAMMPQPVRAQLEIDITQGNIDPIPIAVVALGGDGPREQQIGADIARVIRANLERSGLFRPIDEAAFIQQGPVDVTAPRFGDWRTIGARALVVGRVLPADGGRLRVEIRLFDTGPETQMTGSAFTIVPENWRRAAHIFSDAIFTRITGEDGYFDSRIVYIAESGDPRAKSKRLAIMDQDGENHRFLTDGRALVLTPRFSPTSQEITYMSYFGDRPRVYLFNLSTGQQELLGDFPGMTFAPRFSPDGQRVIMSQALAGNSDIYTLQLRTRQRQRLTDNPAIDTSPSYSPDGRFIAFNSDRGGSQQLYVMDANGGNVKRISFSQGRYATPVWSPRGDLIAFTRIHQGQFFIGVMRTDGSAERMLASGFLVEGPTWAPNGRFLLFYRQDPNDGTARSGRTRIYSIDLTGRNEREVITPVGASDPAWSPILSKQ